MAPRDVAPVAALHILLEEQMINAIVIDRGVGLVHPELIRPAVVLRFMDIAAQDIHKADVFIGDCGHGDRRVGLGHLLGAERPAVQFQIVHQAGMHVDEGCGPMFGLAAPAHQKAGVGRGNGGALRHFAAGQQLAIEVKGHGAGVSVQRGRHLIPLVLGQAVALVAPERNPFVPRADLERQAAVALISQHESGLAAFAELRDKAGQQFRPVFHRVGVVPLERAGRRPNADRQAAALHSDVALVVGDIGRVAIKEQTAAFHAGAAPLRVLRIHIDGVGVKVVQLCVGQVPGSVGDGRALAFIKRQMQKQIFFRAAPASGQHDARRCRGQQQGDPFFSISWLEFSFLCTQKVSIFPAGTAFG